MPQIETMNTEKQQNRVHSKASMKVAFQRQLNVMHAIILRDIRSRFFNHGLGFLIQPLFPVAHILILLGIYTFMGRSAVFGDDLKLFFATGLVPVLTINYISRFMSQSLLANKNMLGFPAVHLMDIVLARSVLEFLGIVISTFIIVTMLLATGTDPSPYDLAGAVACMVVTALFAVGTGVFISVISAMLPAVSFVYALSTVIIYLSSGAPVYLGSLPDKYLYYLSFNPAWQAVTWMRTSYYMGYPQQYLDKTYLVMCCLISLMAGFALERMMRKTIMS